MAGFRSGADVLSWNGQPIDQATTEVNARRFHGRVAVPVNPRTISSGEGLAKSRSTAARAWAVFSRKSACLPMRSEVHQPR